MQVLGKPQGFKAVKTVVFLWGPFQNDVKVTYTIFKNEISL
jgi:hypothetical protein